MKLINTKNSSSGKKQLYTNSNVNSNTSSNRKEMMHKRNELNSDSDNRHINQQSGNLNIETGFKSSESSKKCNKYNANQNNLQHFK